MTSFLPALEGLRGLAILLVLIQHLSILRTTRAFDASVIDVLHTGWVGVDLFFVLSGFLITGILIDARDSDRYFVSFYTRRTLRLFPLYYLIVFFSYHVLPQFPAWYQRLVGLGEVPPEWYFWLYLSNFAFAERDQMQHGVLIVTWTLAVEEQFYLLWAVIVWVCRPRWLGPLCALIVLSAPVFRAVAMAGDAHHVDIHVLTSYRADALASGGWLAWRSRQPAPESVFRFAPWAVVAGVLGVVGLVWWDGHLTWDTWAKQSIGYSFLALAASGLLVCAMAQPERSLWVRTFSTGWLRAFGRYSYCLYLIHTPVMWTMRDFVFDPNRAPLVLGSALPAQFLFWFVAVIPAFALAWASWRWFEGPFLRLKRFFPY